MKVDESMEIKEKSNQIKMNLIMQCTKNKEEKTFKLIIYNGIDKDTLYIIIY